MARLGWIGMPSCCASSSSQSRKQAPRLVQEAKKSRSLCLEFLMGKKMVEIQHQNSTAFFSVGKMLLIVTVWFFVALTLASFGVSGLATSCDKKPTLRPVPKVPRINPASLVSSNHQRSKKNTQKRAKTVRKWVEFSVSPRILVCFDVF